MLYTYICIHTNSVPLSRRLLAMKIEEEANSKRNLIFSNFFSGVYNLFFFFLFWFFIGNFRVLPIRQVHLAAHFFPAGTPRRRRRRTTTTIITKLVCPGYGGGAAAAFKSIMLAGRGISHALVSSRTRTIILTRDDRPSRFVSSRLEHASRTRSIYMKICNIYQLSNTYL